MIWPFRRRPTGRMEQQVLNDRAKDQCDHTAEVLRADLANPLVHADRPRICSFHDLKAGDFYIGLAKPIPSRIESGIVVYKSPNGNAARCALPGCRCPRELVVASNAQLNQFDELSVVIRLTEAEMRQIWLHSGKSLIEFEDLIRSES